MATLTTSITLSIPSIKLPSNSSPISTPSTFPLSKRKNSSPPLFALPPLLTTAADLDTSSAATLAVIGGGSVAALAAVLSIADPEKRRQQQAEEVGGGDKEVVREYFNGTGFQRWKKIYGETDEVNKVQLDIRIGHAKTVENVMKMLKDEGSLNGVTVCDAGCGTGSLSVPLAKEGALVSASDISAAMVAEAESKGLGREKRRQLIPIEKSAIKEFLGSRKIFRREKPAADKNNKKHMHRYKDKSKKRVNNDKNRQRTITNER